MLKKRPLNSPENNQPVEKKLVPTNTSTPIRSDLRENSSFYSLSSDSEIVFNSNPVGMTLNSSDQDMENLIDFVSIEV